MDELNTQLKAVSIQFGGEGSKVWTLWHLRTKDKGGVNDQLYERYKPDG